MTLIRTIKCFLLNHFLEARKQKLAKIIVGLGGIEDKKVVFWDFLTFTLAVEDKKIYEDVMHG